MNDTVINELLQKSHESLRADRILLDQGFSDFAVPRAYYAMFYAAEAVLLDRGLTFSKHTGVIAAFGQHFAKTGRVFWILPDNPLSNPKIGEDLRVCGDHRPFLRCY